MLRLIRLLFLLPILLLSPAHAQDVRTDSLNGWGINLKSFENAAKRANRADWPSVKEGRPGTRVQITFDTNNADVTLVIPAGQGSGSLLEKARRIAAELQLPQADFITVETPRTAIVDIELNDYLQRHRLGRQFNLDLSALAAALSRADLPQPIVLGMKKDEAVTLSAGGTTRTLKDEAWFAAPTEVLPNSRATYELALSWRVIPALLLFAWLPLSIIFATLHRTRKQVTPKEPQLTPSPEEVQRRYDRMPPIWIFALGATCVPLLLIFFGKPSQMFEELELLIPGGMFWMVGAAGLAMAISTLVQTARKRKEQRTSNESELPGETVLPNAEDKPPAWASFGPIGVMLLAPLGGMFYFLIPVYNQQTQLWLRYGIFGWMGLTLVAAVVVGWLGRRATRTELKSGPWFDLVTDLATQAQVPVRHVVLVRSPFANAYASIWGTVGLTTSLVRQLEPEEVRAVVAHELGHLQLKHPHRNLVISLVTACLLLAGWWGLRSVLAPAVSEELRVLLNGPIFIIFVMPLLQMLFMGKGMRAREEQADRLAVQWIGDPEVVIRTIERIHHLNQSPARLKPSDEALLSHPSLVHRLAAIRKLEILPEN